MLFGHFGVRIHIVYCEFVQVALHVYHLTNCFYVFGITLLAHDREVLLGGVSSSDKNC